MKLSTKGRYAMVALCDIALQPGDGLIAVRSNRVRRGQIRCFQHPHRPGFWLVKRVGHIRGDTFEAVSDNRHAASVDSRRFGFVPIDGSFRMVARVPTRREPSVP